MCEFCGSEGVCIVCGHSQGEAVGVLDYLPMYERINREEQRPRGWASVGKVRDRMRLEEIREYLLEREFRKVG